MRADANDAINFLKGNGFVAKDGEIAIGYYRTETQAVDEASRNGAIAYKIIRDDSRAGATAIALVELDTFDTRFSTPAESIAESVREALNVGKNDFISPIMKSRAIVLLKSTCQDTKPLAFEAYSLLFPYSKKEQFDRLWSEVSDFQSSDEESDQDNNALRTLNEFAKSRSMIDALPLIKSGNSKGLISFIELTSARLVNVISTIEMARKIGAISAESAKSLSGDSERFCAVRQAEEKHGSVIKILKQYPNLRKFVASRNQDAIADFLSSRMDKSDAKEYAEEMVKLSNLIKSNSI